MTVPLYNKMEKKEIKVDVVEEELLQPIYRSTVMPIRKGETYGQKTKFPGALMVVLAVFLVSCILCVPLVMYLTNHFTHLTDEDITPAEILEREVMGHNEKVIEEFLHTEESES